MAQWREHLLARQTGWMTRLSELFASRRPPLRLPDQPVKLTIRDAESRDCAAIATMANGLAETTSTAGGAMTTARVERDLLQGRGLSLIVGEVAGTVQSYALTSVAYDTANGARGLYLSDLYVAETARRLGLGRAMMRELARRCDGDGGVFIWWIVMPGNPGAEAFYASLDAAVDPPKAMAVHGRAFEALLNG